MNNNLEIVNLFISHKADPFLKNKHGKVPLDYTAPKKNCYLVLEQYMKVLKGEVKEVLEEESDEGDLAEIRSSTE